jgi:hypothetical protein
VLTLYGTVAFCVYLQNNIILIQAYLLGGICDSQHQKIEQLEEELARTKKALNRNESEYSETLWALHNLSNGAAHAVTRLYRAGELQHCISYDTKDSIQKQIWRSADAMDSFSALELYPGQ